jgi:FtsP/CotA-like multicopper oxidase with cupredoxin domain
MSEPTLHRRRDFLRLSAGAVAGAWGVGALPEALQAGILGGPAVGPLSGIQDARNPMHLPEVVDPVLFDLVAAPGEAHIGGGTRAPAWMINGQLPSPMLRLQRGSLLDVTMVNRLPEPLILHWHGLAPPEAMDGHPRLAVASGEEYHYRFPVEDRAGTYWYHSHAHMRTGFHTWMGIAGLLVVDDPEEAALGLPDGEHELPIILQDRRLDPRGVPVYQAMGPSMMAGVMGDTPFANGVRDPYREVENTLYRLRLLNGSNARIFNLARSDGRPLVVVGNDGGLLERPVEVTSLFMGVGERLDLLLDLSDRQVGDRVSLVSLPFTIPGSMGGGMGRGMGGRGGMGGMMAEANRQGEPLELVEFRVTESARERRRIPQRLLPLPPAPDQSGVLRQRHFRFDSRMMNHTINGRTFDMDRIDERVPFDETEIWTFENVSGFPHPVHLHATHFRVLSRTGGRGRVFPWEEGRKDTVLVWPGERVEVALRFTAHRGLFLLHCHNLEHEDHGMMMNFLVE